MDATLPPDVIMRVNGDHFDWEEIDRMAKIDIGGGSGNRIPHATLSENEWIFLRLQLMGEAAVSSNEYIWYLALKAGVVTVSESTFLQALNHLRQMLKVPPSKEESVHPVIKRWIDELFAKNPYMPVREVISIICTKAPKACQKEYLIENEWFRLFNPGW